MTTKKNREEHLQELKWNKHDDPKEVIFKNLAKITNHFAETYPLTEQDQIDKITTLAPPGYDDAISGTQMRCGFESGKGNTYQVTLDDIKS